MTIYLLRKAARQALHGVGDKRFGEWDEWTGRSFHLRRRLATLEQLPQHTPRDIRGTPEESLRLAAWQARLKEQLP
jgi:hypothetical protein